MAISLKSTVAAPVAAYPALKASIVLFDCNPGTRSWTVPEGVSKIRAFVVGGGGQNQGSGGGYEEKLITVTPGQVLSYTVGAPGTSGATTGGTSSFGGVISATGGATLGGTPGIGSGGEVSTSGGLGMATSNNQNSGGASGHAFGNGQAGKALVGGGFSAGNLSFVDGWKIGLISDSYGRGGAQSTGYGIPPGLGGGGAGASGSSYQVVGNAIVGGGGGYLGDGGTGLVGIEVIA